MGLPKKIKKNIDLIDKKTLLPRRHEIADMISQDGTYLPKSLLHPDLDRGFLDFVRDKLTCVVEGNTIPMIDILITTQNWAQFTETWDFQNLDKNVEPPFIAVVRSPEVTYGNNPSLMTLNIPERRQYYYAKVPTWDGQRNGFDIYKIPQPIPVDIKYTVIIVCNRMRELNKFNQIVLTKFASKQAYQVIKGHYIPIIMGNIQDESVMDLEKRKVYLQKYEFTLQGFLMDEDEFEIRPAITRTFEIYETETGIKRKKQKKEQPQIPGTYIPTYKVGNLVSVNKFEYTVNLKLSTNNNVDVYQAFINDDYYGNSLTEIQLNTGDTLRIVITKYDNSKDAEIVFTQELI
jgi:hypothetical protein